MLVLVIHTKLFNFLTEMFLILTPLQLLLNLIKQFSNKPFLQTLALIIRKININVFEIKIIPKL